MIALLYVPEKQIEHYSPKTAKLVSKIKTIISGNKKV
jgi:hypothetical protein